MAITLGRPFTTTMDDHIAKASIRLPGHQVGSRTEIFHCSLAANTNTHRLTGLSPSLYSMRFRALTALLQMQAHPCERLIACVSSIHMSPGILRKAGPWWAASKVSGGGQVSLDRSVSQTMRNPFPCCGSLVKSHSYYPAF